MQQYKKHYKKNSSGKSLSEEPKPEFVRVKLPRGREVIGLIEQRLGGNKMMVICSDKKNRNCRVPGRLKRALWLRPNDFVIVEPWEFDDEKGDVLFKYSPAAIQWLRDHEHLKNIEEA